GSGRRCGCCTCPGTRTRRWSGMACSTRVRRSSRSRSRQTGWRARCGRCWMRSDVPRGRSIELKLPLLIGGLLVLAIGGFSAAAYTEVRRSTLVAAAERLERVTRQLADILQAGAPQRTADVREVAADPTLRAYPGRATAG